MATLAYKPGDRVQLVRRDPYGEHFEVLSVTAASHDTVTLGAPVLRAAARAARRRR